MAKSISKEEHPLSLGVSIANQTAEQEPYVPTDKETKVVSEVFNKFRAAADNRNRTFQYFDGRNLVEMINDCVGRFITNFDERDGIEDWQARAHVPLTHGKVIAVLGKIVSQLPIAEVNPRFDDDTKKAQLLSDLYSYAEDIDDYEELMICAALEAIVKGTVVGYEGYEEKSRVVRDVIGYDSEHNPKIKISTVVTNKLYGSIVPLEQFYPSSVSIRKVEDMPYAFRRYVIPYSSFIEEFSCYPRYDLVNAKYSVDSSDSAVLDIPFYRDFISTDVDDGNVEIICYYNKDTDEYVLVANGIWLNPMKNWEVAPNPFRHKRLPFWSARFDTLGSDFFYGKSLVDRLSSLQDILNVLTNMLLDQSFLTIFPPILTAGIDPIEEDYLRPGRRVPVDTQGLPLNQSFMKLDLGTPGGWHQFILEYTKRIMEEASIDQVASGTAGVGGRTTAEEIRAASAGVAAILGVFGKLYNTGIKNKAYLKCSNILQFWTDPKYPIISNLLGEKAGTFAEAFNVVSVNNARLANGKRGKKIIAMYPSTEQFPSKSEIDTRSMLYQAETGSPVEIHAVTGDYLRNLQYDIKLVPNTKSAETKEINKALTLEKIRVYKSFFPDANNDELKAMIAEAFGDDPSRIFAPNAEQQQAVQPGQETVSPMGTQPEGAVANNMVRQMMGGETSAMQMRDIAR